MSFDSLETSRESSRPVELFEFTVAPYSYLYTSAEDPITVFGSTYRPAAIGRGPIKLGAGDREAALVLTVPADDDFVVRHAAAVPSTIARCNVLRMQRGAPGDVITLFRGIAKSVEFKDDARVATVIAQLETACGNRKIPKSTWKHGCNHFLYDDSCQVDPTLHRYVGTVTSIAANIVTVAGIGSSSLKFKAGIVKPQGGSDARMVIDQFGDSLRLNVPFYDLALGAIVEVNAGCDHQFDGDCTVVFDNGRKHGGHPFMPRRDIFSRGVIA